MQSTINALFTVLGIVLAGAAIGPVYRAVKTEAVTRIHHGLPPLEAYTRKLTGGPAYFPARVPQAHTSHRGHSQISK